MSKKTKDTNSDIDTTPETLYTPGYDKEGPKEGLVKIGVHDISSEAKTTIGDFLSRVTAGKAGTHWALAMTLGVMVGADFPYDSIQDVICYLAVPKRIPAVTAGTKYDLLDDASLFPTAPMKLIDIS